MAFRELLSKKVQVHLNSSQTFFGNVLRQTETMVWFSSVQTILSHYEDEDTLENKEDRVVPVASISYMEIMTETDKES